jgi:hypothetical protein
MLCVCSALSKSLRSDILQKTILALITDPDFWNHLNNFLGFRLAILEERSEKMQVLENT